MLCGSDNIPHSILGNFPHSDRMWEIPANTMWNIVMDLNNVTSSSYAMNP